MKLPDPIKGQKINMLTLISDPFKKMISEKSTPMKYATVRCKCGREKDIRISLLKLGRPISCGCIRELSWQERKKIFAHETQLLASTPFRSLKNRNTNLNGSISNAQGEAQGAAAHTGTL